MSTQPPDPVHFLMVDDLEENLLALEGLLRREGLVALKARSGPEALEFLLSHDVALALIDVQMPEMDGFELAELMRGSERTRRIPIIFLTAGTSGASDRQRRFRGYETGAVDFLQKPIEPDILRSKAEVFFDLFRQRQEVGRLLKESRGYAEALQDADRRKDEFLAMLAHELRNPLAAVSNAIQVSKRSTLPEHDAWAKQVIEGQVGNLSRLVDDLTDVSRITRGKIELRRQLLDPKPVLEHAIAAVIPLIRARKHELSASFGHGDTRVEADPTRLEQVVVNLLNNAAKYSEDGGRIALRTEASGGSLVIAVTDTGQGIPPEQLPRMFELFAQGDRSMARSEGGLGIGLTLVKSLVEMHGGTVSAESGGRGLGSTFTVRIPASRVARPSPERLPDAPAPTAPKANGTRLKILIVDDNLDTARGLSRLMELLGHEVRTTHDGREAIAAADQFAPDVVLLDIGLPGMDGYEVVRRLRLHDDCRNAQIMAVSGYGQAEDRRRSREAGFDHHFIKPLDVDELMAVLRPD